ALPFETWWIGGSRRAVYWGALSALGAVLLQPFAGSLPPPAPAGIAAWHWLLPLAWASTLIPRLNSLRNPAGTQPASLAGDRLEDIIDAVVLR
ncbi:PAS domain-containing sensor histidine kinase, partial [Mesorhizobium sp. M8A.F.Ca.ET.213.01.1.1]